MTDLDDAPSPASLRAAGDSWTINELLGATTLGVAASRAAETDGPCPLIRDEFARILVSPAGPAWVAIEVFDMNTNSNTQRWLRMRERLGLDVNVAALTYHEPDRSDAAQWLSDHDWAGALRRQPRRDGTAGPRGTRRIGRRCGAQHAVVGAFRCANRLTTA